MQRLLIASLILLCLCLVTISPERVSLAQETDLGCSQDCIPGYWQLNLQSLGCGFARWIPDLQIWGCDGGEVDSQYCPPDTIIYYTPGYCVASAELTGNDCTAKQAQYTPYFIGIDCWLVGNYGQYSPCLCTLGVVDVQIPPIEYEECALIFCLDDEM